MPKELNRELILASDCHFPMPTCERGELNLQLILCNRAHVHNTALDNGPRVNSLFFRDLARKLNLKSILSQGLFMRAAAIVTTRVTASNCLANIQAGWP